VVAVNARRILALAAAVSGLAVAAGAAPASAKLPGCGPTGVPGGEWRGYGGDYRNTRTQFREKSIAAADVPLLTPAWTFSTVKAGGAGDITGTPSVADGCMYVGSSRGWVFSVNADTGKLVWKRKLPYGGGVNSSVTVATRTVLVGVEPPCRKAKPPCAQPTRFTRRSVGTVFVAITRTQKFEGNCPPGDPCEGPYVAAFDQATGKLAWVTKAIDRQPGADSYASPVVFDHTLIVGTSGGSAELGDESDRYAFQGSMNFIDADSGRLLKKTWTIHPPKKPDDQYAGATIWSTPAVDTQAKVAFVGTSNPFKPQAEHKYANAVIKLDVNRRSPRFGRIIGSYKGLVDNYFPEASKLPCYDIPGNPPPYYPQGAGACGNIDLDFGAAPNLFQDAKGRKLVGAGQKSGVYHVFDARTMKPVWKQIVGPAGALGGIVGSTANDGHSVYGPITVPGYVWSLSADRNGAYKWLGPIADGLHWGPPVSLANGVVYSVDFNGFLDAFDARNGTLLTRRPLTLGGSGPVSPSWAGVSVARNTIYAAVGVLGLADGFVVAFRPGAATDAPSDALETAGGLGSGGGGGGGGQPAPVGPSIVAGPGAASTGYATRVVTTSKGGPLSFMNLDVVQHDVVAKQKGADGRALFHSKLIGLGESAPVEGLDRVQSGQTYDFFCSVHPGMQGQLVVR
jgi:polyvinyl alcohol dehydrogenase (cytochrome)